MASRTDLKQQQDKLKIKAELLAAKVRQMENAEKVKDLQSRLRRMGGR